MNRERWLKAWGYIDGTPEADKAWQAKQSFVPFRLPSLIVSDIEPYQAMGTDVATGSAPMITSRSQHREYLARNGYIEVGNEKPQASPKPTVTDAEIAQDIKRTIQQNGIKL